LKRAIQHAITQKEPLLQKVGCVSLEARADRWAVGVLERLAVDSSFSSRSQALEALGHLQSTRSLPLLQAAAKEDDPGISRAALDALRRIKAS
jgi:HEAT repeat protein